MASFPWSTPTSRTTGIAAQSIPNTEGFVSSSIIDNSSNLDDTLDLSFSFTCASASTGQTVFYVYLLYSIDGTDYEDGSTTIQPVKVPIASIQVRAVTTAQLVNVPGIPIPPQPFKIMIWNAVGYAVTFTVLADTYRRGYAA